MMKCLKMLFGFFCLIAFMPGLTFADEQLSNQYLQRALSELDAAKVYVQQAKEQEAPNQRVVFHYEDVLSDIDKIEGGIQEKFNMPKVQPRTIEPVSGDYIGLVGQDDQNSQRSQENQERQ
jgi:RAQPRD family integrative conjugative element protein